MDGFAVGRYCTTRLWERGEYSCGEGRFHFSEALVQNFDLGFVAFFVVVLLLCAALILVDGTVFTTSHVLTSSCHCLFSPFPPLFPLIRLVGMLGSNLMVMGIWIGGPCHVAFNKV